MISVTMSVLAQHLNGTLHGQDGVITSVSTDSRNIPAQCLFIALKGERFDGHDFVDTAIKNGAVALLVDHL